MMKGGVEVDQVKIGNFLKKLRKEKGITQEQLAEILNVSGRTVSRWENEKKLSRFTNADRYKQSVWNLSWYVDKGGFKDGKDNR